MFCVAVLRAAYVGFLPAHSTDKDVKYRPLDYFFLQCFGSGSVFGIQNPNTALTPHSWSIKCYRYLYFDKLNNTGIIQTAIRIHKKLEITNYLSIRIHNLVVLSPLVDDLSNILVRWIYKIEHVKGTVARDFCFWLRLWGFRLGPTDVTHPLLTFNFNLLRLFKEGFHLSKTDFIILPDTHVLCNVHACPN